MKNVRLVFGVSFLVLFSTITSTAETWGTGSEAGSISSTLWTPGRDGNGLVNKVSWDLVPLNQWLEVAGTRLDGLDATVKAAVPGWRDRGNEGWGSVTNDWNGMAWDERTGSERGWIAVGGGHDGGSNDGIYELTLRKMQWRVQRFPHDNSWWPSSYSGGYTYFPPASAYYNAHPTNALGVWGDEFFDSTNLEKSIRTPTARHTYGSCVFASSLGDSGKILMGCRRYWEYDLATDSWSLPKFPFGNQVGYTAAVGMGYTGENMQGWWNDAEGRYYVCATQDYGSSQAWSVLAGGTGWRWEGWYPLGGWNAFITAQERIDRTLYTLLYDNSSKQGKPYSMIATNLDSRGQTTYPVVMGPSLASVSFAPSDGFDGQGMTFVPELGKWLCNAKTNHVLWCWLDTTNWTLDSLPVLSAASNQATENKVKYLPDMHALVWVNTADQNVYLMKFSSGNTVVEKQDEIESLPTLNNSPEPFNPQTLIRYRLPYAAKVNLSIFNASGHLVRALESANKPSGDHSIRWTSTDMKGASVTSGMYFCRLAMVRPNGKTTTISKKMILLR